VTILEAGRALRERRVSSVELTKQAVDRIATSTLNAFMTMTAEAALARAKSADQDLARGVDRGPLHGIPIAHKDAFLTKGVRTTAGSKIFADYVPDRDAEIVTRLDQAGAVVLGKTGLHELCHGITSNNPHFGAVLNPWNADRIPGGSSGGSGAAVAAGLVFLATGTDTGGSVRIPAAYCGVVGLKPTFGLLSCQGVVPLAFTLDHVGPLTRTVRDAAVSFQVMLGRAADIPLPDVKGLRIGVPENFFFEHLDPEVMLAVRRSVQILASLGARVEEVRLPDPSALNTTGRMIQLAEASTIWRRFESRRSEFGADVYALIQQGLLIPATDYLDAQRYRRILAREFSKVWTQVDCLLTPATPVPAPEQSVPTVWAGDVEEDVRIASTRLTRPFNVLGWPALAMPCGFSEAELPMSVQLVAAPQQEQTLLRAAAALEDALALGDLRPGDRHPRM
jgi:aspartyl-tRNA(Asn)/glutamyl-tRNA(Gln) amidotransferase subunit A